MVYLGESLKVVTTLPCCA